MEAAAAAGHRRAAEQGDRDAQISLARCYMEGSGTPL